MQTKNERTLKIKTPFGEKLTTIDLEVCKNLLDLYGHCSNFFQKDLATSRSIFSATTDSRESATHSIRLLGNNQQDLLRCYGETFYLEDLELGFDARISIDDDSIIVCEITVEQSPKENASFQLV